MHLAIVLLASAAAFGQTFEVASIRPAAPGSRGGRGQDNPIARGSGGIAVKDVM